MHDFIGKMCPYCRTPFQQDDEVVKCSACEMPHHKDCWVENRGCTTFGCTGTISGVNNTANTATATQMSYQGTPQGVIFCTRCGTRNTRTSFFCFKCGNRLRTGNQ